MFHDHKKYHYLLVILFLIVVNIYLFHLDLQGKNRGLTVAMLDVGQGDAIFIESPTGTQLLVDVGPPRKILSKLSVVMSPFDRHIDGVIITNPDADHIGGFSDVLKTYKVEGVFEPGTYNSSSTFQNLKNEIEKRNIPNFLAKKGMRLDIGGGAFIDILFPDRNVSSWDSNDGSVVMKLVYGETSVMLTGDVTGNIERLIIKENAVDILDSDILKVAHHGSYTSSSDEFVRVVSPKFALVSLGKDNKYGHPHKDTLDTLLLSDAEIFRTDLGGSIIMKSDGKNEVFTFIK